MGETIIHNLKNGAYGELKYNIITTDRNKKKNSQHIVTFITTIRNILFLIYTIPNIHNKRL